MCGVRGAGTEFGSGLGLCVEARMDGEDDEFAWQASCVEADQARRPVSACEFFGRPVSACEFSEMQKHLYLSQLRVFLGALLRFFKRAWTTPARAAFRSRAPAQQGRPL